MKDRFIRNREKRIITKFDGSCLRDDHRKLVAHYDTRNDVTRAREGRIVGNGDLRFFQLGKVQPDK